MNKKLKALIFPAVVVVIVIAVILSYNLYSRSNVLVGASQRVLTLPEDGCNMYLSIIVDENWRADTRSVQIVNWMRTEPWLKAYAARTNFTFCRTVDPTYKTRFEGYIPETPCIIVQDKEGYVRYKASGSSLPTSAYELASNLSIVWEHRPWLKPCPCPSPTPAPAPAPTPAPIPIPNIGPAPCPDQGPPPQPAVPWGLMVGAGLLAGILTFVVQWAIRVNGSK